MMAADGKTGLPVIANPERMSKIPPHGPDDDKKAYIERQIKSWQTIGSPAYPIDETVPAAEDKARCGAVLLSALRGSAGCCVAVRRSGGPADEAQLDSGANRGHSWRRGPSSVEGGCDVGANIPGAEIRIIPGMDTTYLRPW